tara:strand:- start:860 stop:991 length:132 start_codon:yes stop_codon:yes gene_type:complete
MTLTGQLMAELLNQNGLRLYLGQQKRRELPQFIGVFRQGFFDV